MDNRNHGKPNIRRKNPSFSSSLLDEIYRSIDDQTAAAAATKEEHHKTGKKTDQNVDMMMPFNKVVGRKKSASAEYYFPQSFRLNSCSTSSDSSIWTSSESETFGQSKLAARTSFSSQQQHHHRHHQHHQQKEDDKIYVSQRKMKNECGVFVKAKSKTLKMYGDMKNSKAKQPISPGSRLASFLNSLFTSTRNAKKTKIDERKYKSASSACSSASSFTRSCFSKTPSSRGKLSDGVKRSVRFYPVISVIMDEDYRYKDNGRHNYDNIPARNSICSGEEIREHNRRAREVLKNYEKKLEECKMMDEDDDEDCESCASSDLFELDNLDSVTASRERYCEELPVYETTSLDANRAIAHGLLL